MADSLLREKNTAAVFRDEGGGKPDLFSDHFQFRPGLTRYHDDGNTEAPAEVQRGNGRGPFITVMVQKRTVQIGK